MILPHEKFWTVFKSTNGALSACESIAIMTIADQAPVGTYIELGTHYGKSSMSALVGLTKEVVMSKKPFTPNFILVDPIFTDRTVVDEVASNLSIVHSNISLQFVDDISTNIIDKYGPYSYVFSDAGSHSDEIPMQEVKMLEDNMVKGGIIAFHDVFSQFIKQTEAYEYLLSTGKYEKIEINWHEIFDYVKEHDLESNNSSWHQYPDLPHPPNFVGAVRRL